MVIASIFTSIFGILIFLFIFWKRLREDYSAEIIFKAAFDILIGILIGFLVTLRFLPQAFFWFGLIGAMGGLGIAIFRLRIKFYETLEALIIAALPWISFIFLFDSVAHSSLSSFLAFLAVLIMVFISYYLDAHYKNFTWYRSGKIGFAGIATISIFFILRSILAIFGISMISFVSSKPEAVISAASAFICFTLLFNLSKVE